MFNYDLGEMLNNGWRKDINSVQSLLNEETKPGGIVTSVKNWVYCESTIFLEKPISVVFVGRSNHEM